MTLSAAGFGALPATAGLYSEDEKCPFTIKPDGTAEELTYPSDLVGGAFPLVYAKAGNIGDDRPRRVGNTDVKRINEDRTAVLQRVAKPLANPTPAQAANRAADLIRLRQYSEALNLLMRRDRQSDFRVLANLAHAAAVRGEWADALNYHEAAMESTFPDDLGGTSPEQRVWLQRVEKEYYRRWLRLRGDEARRKLPMAQDKLFPLFESKKPPDAVAIVQQLLLWCPEDNRLYWLLAELYAESGRLRQAEKILDSLVSEDRRYSPRTLLDRRSEVKQAVAALPKEVEPDLAPPTEPDHRTLLEKLGLDTTRLVLIVVAFGTWAVILLALQYRKIARRKLKRSSGTAA